MIPVALVFASVISVGAPADEAARDVLKQEQFAFCHDEDFPLTEEEGLAWCPVLKAQPSENCPAFVRACDAARADVFGSGRFESRSAKQGESAEQGGDVEPKRGRGGGKDRRAEREELEVEVPAMGGIGQLLFWIVIIVAVGALVYAIGKNASSARREEEEEGAPRDREEDPEDAAAAAAWRQMETDVDKLLAMAQDAERHGQFAESVDFSHAALLRRLDHEGMIRLHRSRTNGDYVRDLRDKPDWRAPVRSVLREVDRAQFGMDPPSGDQARTIFQQIVKLARQGVGGALALLLLVGLVGCPELQKSYSWAPSPSGTEGVIEYLQSRDLEVGYRSEELKDLEPNGTIVLLEEAAPSDEEWQVLREWVDDGGTLIVASGLPTPLWVGAGFDGFPYLTPDLPAPLTYANEYDEYDEYNVYDPETVGFAPGTRSIDLTARPQTELWIEREGKPYAVVRQRIFGEVIVLADHHLFTNAGLTTEYGPWLLDEMVDAPRVELVDAYAGMGADTPFESIRRSNLTPAVIQLLLFVLVLYLWRGIAFGRGRDPAPPSRRAFADHARAMGLQYRKARAAGHASSAYALWALDWLRDRFPTAGRQGLHALAQTAAQRTGRDETPVMRLLVEAHGAAESKTGSGDPAADLGLVRQLGQLIRECGGMQ